jgi:N-acetylglucosamine repressor
MLPEPYQLAIPSHRQILNTIRIQKEISGADLARLNNLQPSTLVYILRSLKARGLIQVSRIAAQPGVAGKPPTLWQLAPDKGYIIGLEIIPNEVRATVINFQCTVVHQEHKIGLHNIGPGNLISSTEIFTKELLEHLGLARDKVIGVGVALTGLVDREAGVVRFSRKLELENFPIQQLLRQQLDFPVEVVNDANAGALGIKWQVDEPVITLPHVIFLTLNEKTGYFGAGLILNQNLYEGANGTAGEIGDPLPSLDEFIERARKKVGSEHLLLELIKSEGSIDIEDVIYCAKKGCVLSREILEQYSQLIIEEILRIVQLLAPNVIILGGDITDARDLIYASIVERVNARLRQLFPFGIMAPEIQFSRFGSYSVSVGATALILRRIFAV